MTTTELTYWQNKETERTNRAREQETERSNRANESIGRSQAAAALSQAASAASNARANTLNAYTRQGELQHKRDTWFWNSAMDLVGNIASPF